MTAQPKAPPVHLVKTWYDLLMQKDNPAARERATQMLLGAFGDMQSVAKYLKENNIA